MHIILRSLFIVIVLTVTTSCIRAQEVVVPFDTAGKVISIDSTDAGRMHMFSNIGGFRTARLLQKTDSTYSLETEIFNGQSVVRELHPFTRHQLDSIVELYRERSAIFPGAVHNADEEPSEDETELQGGSRSKFIAYCSLLSFFVYGPMISVSSSPSSLTESASVIALVGGVGFATAYLLTYHKQITDGQSSLGLGGAFLGIGHGFLLDNLFTNGNIGSELGFSMAIVSAAEAAANTVIAGENHYTEGRSDMMRYGSLLTGIEMGGATFFLHPNPSAAFMSGMSLLGSGVGYYLGNIFDDGKHITRGDATVMLTSGIYGSYVGFLLGSIVASPYSSPFADNNFSLPKAQTTVSLVAIATSLASMYIASGIIDDKELPTSTGNYILFATTAGCTIGTIVGATLDVQTSYRSSIPFCLPALIGTIGGFAISSLVFLHNGNSAKSTGDLDVRFDPTSALAARLMPKSSVSGAATSIPPVFSLTYRW